jgi:hypothetical protein
MKYQAAGNRNQGRPLKRLLGCYIETGTGRDACVLESITMKTMTVVALPTRHGHVFLLSWSKVITVIISVNKINLFLFVVE